MHIPCARTQPTSALNFLHHPFMELTLQGGRIACWGFSAAERHCYSATTASLYPADLPLGTCMNTCTPVCIHCRCCSRLWASQHLNASSCELLRSTDAGSPITLVLHLPPGSHLRVFADQSCRALQKGVLIWATTGKSKQKYEHNRCLLLAEITWKHLWLEIPRDRLQNLFKWLLGDPLQRWSIDIMQQIPSPELRKWQFREQHKATCSTSHEVGGCESDLRGSLQGPLPAAVGKAIRPSLTAALFASGRWGKMPFQSFYTSHSPWATSTMETHQHILHLNDSHHFSYQRLTNSFRKPRKKKRVRLCCEKCFFSDWKESQPLLQSETPNGLFLSPLHNDP